MKKFFFFILPVAIAALGIAAMIPERQPTDTQAAQLPAPEPKIKTLPVSVPEPAPEPEDTVVNGKIRPGDTVTSLVGDILDPVDMNALATACRPVHPLSRIRPGQPYSVTTRENIFVSFAYEVDDANMLVATKTLDGFKARVEPIDYEIHSEVIAGRIENNLFYAVADTGERPELAVRLADIFAWDIDFCRDIRPGDSFRCLVEKRFRDGTFSGYGRILAARFVNQGDTFNGYLFADTSGREHYFDESGRSLRKVFLKAPLSFRRISSGYSHSRLHPILKYSRPHHGIDYAAPKGTPVWTVGDGVVVARGYNKAAGNYIDVRHNSVYKTRYNHLSRFAKGMKKGTKVRQGQVVGYVGSTGYATGPHLDFRMYKHGKPINPTRFRPPPAKPISGEQMAEFKQAMAPLAAVLDASNQTPMLAETQSQE